MADLTQLAPAPRQLPRGLAVHVWVNNIVLSGVVGMCLASIGFAQAARHAELPGEWHLFWERREAPGWLSHVTTHKNQGKHGHTIRHTYHYSFQLPDGRREQGQCSNDGSQLYHVAKPTKADRRPDLTIEYSPRHPEANRIKGLRASSGGPFVVFVLILPTLALALIVFGLRSARNESRLLRLGEPSAGYVYQCRKPPKKRAGNSGAEGASVTWSHTSKANYQPVAEFRDRIWGEHQANVEAARRMHHNKYAHGCGMAAGFVFCFVFFGAFGAFALAIPTAISMHAMGWMNQGGREIVPILIAGGLGWMIAGILSCRVMAQMQNARVSDAALESRPGEFDRVECLLHFWLSDGVSHGETPRTLRLQGNETDEEARPLLYDPAKPSRTLFITEMTVPPDLDAGGQWNYARPFPFARPALVLLMAAMAAVYTWVFW